MSEQEGMNCENTAETRTIEQNDASESPQNVPVVRMKLKKPKNKKKVEWTAETVDNENMNKKKSKCCCVYVKPHQFAESSSDTDDECEHCRGHVEMKNNAGNIQNDVEKPSPMPENENRPSPSSDESHSMNEQT